MRTSVRIHPRLSRRCYSVSVVSPPLRVEAARQIAESMLLATVRTEPSIMAEFTTPAW